MALIVNIVLRNEKPKLFKSLCAGVTSEALASGKVVWSDPYTEVSQTANTRTDPEMNSGQGKHELHMRHSQWDE